MQYLLDTEMCVDLLRGVESVVAKLRTLSPYDCGISAISSFELFAGAAKARDPRRETGKINTLLAVVRELPFAANEARQAGVLRALLDKAGTPIGAYDLLIAAHALVTKLTLVTANTGEFSQVRDLQLENWR